jgi:hypothetical protein
MKPTRLFVIQCSIIVCAVTASACSTSPIVIPTATLIPVTATPNLELAENFSIGTSDTPEGKYLFIELHEYDSCSDACQCPAVEPPMWAYEWYSGELCLTNNEYYDRSFPASAAAPVTPLLGFYGAGRWQERLIPITALPFEEYYLPIYSVDTDGSIVIGLQGKNYFLRPGQSWYESGTYKSEPPDGCTKYYENRLINHGLIAREQIKACK